MSQKIYIRKNSNSFVDASIKVLLKFSNINRKQKPISIYHFDFQLLSIYTMFQNLCHISIVLRNNNCQSTTESILPFCFMGVCIQHTSYVCVFSTISSIFYYSFLSRLFTRKTSRLIEYENQHSICLSLLIFVSSLTYFSFFIDNPIKNLFSLENLCAPIHIKSEIHNNTRHRMFDLFICVF